jgi:D-serine deaminase-like pyridoxal phosphate-dependent protein
MSDASLSTIGTPCLVLDRLRLERNLARMADWISSRGVRFRPHLKTAKCVEVARLAAPNNDAPVAVSTLLEAEYFFAQGYRDIFYAVGLGPGKIPRIARLLRQGARLTTMIDGIAAASDLSIAATAAGVRFRSVIEIDSGEHRGGLAPDSPDLLPIARALGPGFAGIATHAGHSYAGRSLAEIAAVAAAEVQAARLAADRLAAGGIHCEIVSIGSSPTALASVDLAGITEVRAGVYMFWDLMQAGIGVCSIDDLALSVLAEVIGRPTGRFEFLIDAGAFALSKDTSTASLPPEHQVGYGLVCDLDGRLFRGLMVKRVWQEHGLVVSAKPLDPGMFPVGTRVRVLPNHACPTAAAYDRYYVVEGGHAVTAEWPRINGW